MATALDRIIDGASDPSVSTANLLRDTLAAAHRLQATPVRNWAERELAGYEGVPDDDLPVYRRKREAGAQALWVGYGGSSAEMTLTARDAPEPSFEPWFALTFRQPVSEIESMAGSGGSMGAPWPAAVLGRWNSLAEEGKAVRMVGMSLFSARTLVQTQSLVGVLDAVRTEVMKLGLDLQSAADDAGESGGPTIKDDVEVERAVTTFITNIYGGAPTIAQGASVTQTVTVNVGDIGSLTRAAESLGLAGGDVTEYIEAVLAARSDPDKSRLRKFADKVGSGALALGNGVVGNIAATKLLEWGTTFLGG